MIKFHPKAGQILMCDFEGFIAPEMIKKRPIIVLTPSMQGKANNLVSIVPLSTKKPDPIKKWHFLLEPQYLPDIKFFKNLQKQSWVKADMIYTVSFQRLELIRMGKNKAGKRIYFDGVLPKTILSEIQQCLLQALNIKWVK